MGSTRAEMQTWTVNVESMTAECSGGRVRQIVPTAPRFKVDPLADEVVAKVVASLDDPDLKWLDGRIKARVLVGRIVPGEGVCKETLAGRRKRFGKALRERMAAAGWQVVAGTAAYYATRSSALLAGFVLCKRCGHNYRARQRYSKERTNPTTGEMSRQKSYVYACGQFLDGGPHACEKFHIRRQIIEQPVIDRVRSGLLGSASPEVWKAEVRSVLADAYGAGRQQSRKEELEHRLAECEERLDRLPSGVSVENLQYLDKELTRLGLEKKNLKKELEDISASEGASFNVESAVQEVWKLVQDFQQNFEAAAPDERQRLLRPFLRQIEIDPDAGTAKVELYRMPMTSSEPGGQLLRRKGGTPTGI